MRKPKKCSGCGNPPVSGQAYCASCHAAYMRSWRCSHPGVSPEQKSHAIARAKVGVYVRRGKLAKKPCHCGSVEVQARIGDYANPLASVTWLCRDHHAASARSRA